MAYWRGAQVMILFFRESNPPLVAQRGFSFFGTRINSEQNLLISMPLIRKLPLHR
jgi:hypothetical protein